MNIILHLVLGAALALAADKPAGARAGEQLPSALKAGDRIVFVGDSITEQRNYTDSVEEYLVTRYPRAGFTFFNAGWAGDDSGGGWGRLERDVMALKPDVVTICYGMNDGWYWAWMKETGENFTGNMEGIIGALKKKGIRIVLLTPGIVDADLAIGDFRQELKEQKYNDTLRKLADTTLEIAKKEGLPSYDLHALMTDIQKKGKNLDRKFSIVGEKELGIHPQKPGGLVMAYALLKALGVPPRHEEVAVTASDKAKNLYRFELSALPFFVDEDARPVFKFLPFMDEFNRVALKLPAADKAPYYLRFAGESKGRVLPWDEVKDGVDLASLWDSPVMEQSEWVNAFTKEKDDIYYKFWRSLGMRGNYWQQAPYNGELHKAGIEASLKLEELRRPDILPSSAGYEVEYYPFKTAAEEVSDGGYIRNWSGMGPFPEKKKPLGNEREFTSESRKLRKGWTTVVLNTEEPGNSLGAWFTDRKEISAYLYTVIQSKAAQQAELQVGIDDSFTLWLNGKKASEGARDEKAKQFEKDKIAVKVKLKKGANYLLVRATNKKDSFGFSLKVTGLKSPVSSVPPTLRELVQKTR